VLEFLFIGDTEVCQIKTKVPSALKRTVRQRHATAIKKASRLVGVLSALLLLITPAAIIYALVSNDKVNSGSLITASVATIAFGLALIGSFWLHKKAKHIERQRRRITHGFQREFYVSSIHQSFVLAFTPAIRTLISSGTENGNTVRMNLYAMFADRSVINADADILAAKSNGATSQAQAYEAKALLIEKVEQAVGSSGETMSRYFNERRAYLAKNIESWEKETNSQIASTKALADALTIASQLTP